MPITIRLQHDEQKVLELAVGYFHRNDNLGIKEAAEVLHLHLSQVEKAVHVLRGLGLLAVVDKKLDIIDDHGRQIELRYLKPTEYGTELVRRRNTLMGRLSNLEPAWKLIGAIATFVTLIIAVLEFTGITSLNLFQSAAPRLPKPTPPAIPTAMPGEILTLVAQFDGPNDIQVSNWIWEKLNEEFERANLQNSRIVQIPDIIKSSQQARLVGINHQAMIVIWGSYDNVGVIAHFETIADHADIRVGRQAYRRQGLSPQQAASDPSSASALYFTQGLPNEITYFTSFAVGQVHYWNEQYDDALRSYSLALDVIGDKEDKEKLTGLDAIYFYRGYIYMTIENEPNLAVADFTEAINLRPDDFKEAYNNRGAAYTDLRQFDSALQDLNRAIKIDRSYASAYNNRGNLYRELGQFDSALSDFDTAIKLAPDDATPYIGRGMVFYLQKDYTRANEAYNSAIGLDPTNSVAYNNRGIVLSDQEKWTDALNDFNKAIELNPNFALAYSNRGVLFGKTGKSQEAIADYDRAIELDSKLAIAYFNRAYEYLKLDNIQALNDFSKAIELNTAFTEAYAGRAQVYMALNQYDKAVEDVDTALKLDSDNAFANFALGRIHFHNGNFDLAIQDFSRVIQLDPTEIPSAYYNRALAYMNTNQNESACADISAYLGYDISESDRDSAEKDRQNLGCK